MYLSTVCFAPGGDVGILDMWSVDKLCSGVDVRRSPCFCLVCLLPLFGVLGKKHAGDWLRMANSLPGSALDSSAAADETASEVTVFGAVFLGSLIRVLRGLPERSCTVTI